MKKKNKIRGTLATYGNSRDLCFCDVDELAKTIVKNGRNAFPAKFGNQRAIELCILADGFLKLKCIIKNNGMSEL